MNAIFAAEFWHGASARGLAQGLREVGWKVHEVDVSYPFVRARTAVLRAASRVLGSQSRRAFNLEILSAAADVEADALVTLKGSYIAPETVRALKARGTATVLYYPDVSFGHPDVSLDVIREVDFLFTTKSYHLAFLNELRGAGRSQFLHHGYSPLVHRPLLPQVSEANYRWDVAYVGNPDASKARLLTQVAASLPDLRMIVAGNGWERFAAGTPLAERITRRAVTGDFMAELVQLSRANIAVNGRPADARGWHDRVSTRTFEIPACKGFMLHEDNDELRTLFQPDLEIGVFASAGELCEKIVGYLAKPEERAGMIERAYRRAVPAYSYSARAAEIDSALNLRSAAR